MATAVLEEPVDTVANWKMPAVEVGQTVVWYSGGQRNSTAPSVGQVIHVSVRSVELIIHERDKSHRMRDVRNVEDPQLPLNDNIRENGGWDYCNADKRLMDLAKRVEQLEDRATR